MARAGHESRRRAGGFDIVLTDDAGAFYVAGFSVETTVPAAMGMAFIAAQTPTGPARSLARLGPRCRGRSD
jgi:hypothetical protein